MAQRSRNWVVLFDVEKAFDKVSRHRLVYQTMVRKGFTAPLINATLLMLSKTTAEVNDEVIASNIGVP